MRRLTETPAWTKAPEIAYLVLDMDNETGQEWFDDYGMMKGNRAVVKERLVSPVPTHPTCEQCGEHDDPIYQLADDSAGVGVCLSCLREYEWVEYVATEEMPDSKSLPEVVGVPSLEDLDTSVGLSNGWYEPDHHIYVGQSSGDPEELPEWVCSVLFQRGYSADDIEDGDWITIVDTEVLSVGSIHPFHISVTGE
jgi:hypothetical protein